MKFIETTMVMLALTGAGVCAAAAPPLAVKKSITIAAPAEKVWAASKDFDGLNHWHPALASDEIVSGTNNTPGAVRLLTLKGGGTIKEKLLQFDDTGHRFRYSIVEGVLPVSHYTSTFVVSALGPNKTLVTWSGRFKRKNPGDDPPEAESDKAATDAVNGVYQSGLDNLKKLVQSN